MHVIIVGGGTGGMCLAHGLRRAGISVAVYERYRSRNEGLHGYRVGIDPTGSRALKECLPAQLYDMFVATCARTPAYFNVFTEKLRQTASIELPVHSGEDISERSVSRSTLRQVLFSGMDDVIGFGKVFTRYEQAADGTVTAFLDDGTTASGDILVSAEGTRSAEFPSNAEPDYLNLSIWSVHAKFPAGVHDQRGPDLIGTALGAARNWHPHLRALLERSDPAAAFPVRIVTSAPVDPSPICPPTAMTSPTSKENNRVMGKIVNSTFVSLDGVINHMMGRHTYEIYAQAWPGRDGEYADRINATAKYVASPRPCSVTACWTN